MPEIEQRGAKTSLDRVLEVRNRPATMAARLAILRGLAEQIDAAAGAAGGMNGDLTPENVLVTGDPDGTDVAVALKDTGVRFVPEEELASDGRIPEAARYLSPERILGTTTDVRSHEFSLAIIAYEFVYGRKPFDAPDLRRLFYRVCTGKPEPAGEMHPEAVAAVFARGLAKEPAQRFPNCVAFVGALTAALGQANSASMAAAAGASSGGRAGHIIPAVSYSTSTTRLRRRYEEGPGVREGAAPERSRGKLLGLIAALCLAAVGLTVFFLRYKPAPNLPVQVLDTKAGPTTPAPAEDRVPQINKSPRPEASGAPVPKETHSTPAASFPPEHLTSSAEFLTEPPTAAVVIDGNPSQTCTSPCTLSLPSGRHTLTATLNGYGQAQRIFTVPQDKSLFIALSRRMGTLVVTSVPSGSAIVVDGRNYGVTPATLQLPPGEHKLLLVNGGVRHAETVVVDADTIQAKAIRW